MIYLVYNGICWRQNAVKKLAKRYYVLIFLLALVSGFVLRNFEMASFKIVRSSTVFAPESEVITYEQSGEKAEKINLNEASAYELDSLYGIGEGLAERIIDYRRKNGNFEAIQDIMKVSGIGEKTYNEIKNHIYVE